MKTFKSVILSLLVLFTFISCKNFLSGTELLEELDKAIIDANAPEVDIYIEADANSGVVSPSGKVSFKQGRKFSVIFSESKEYQFMGWEVIDRSSKEVLKML